MRYAIALSLAASASACVDQPPSPVQRRVAVETAAPLAPPPAVDTDWVHKGDRQDAESFYTNPPLDQPAKSPVQLSGQKICVAADGDGYAVAVNNSLKRSVPDSWTVDCSLPAFHTRGTDKLANVPVDYYAFRIYSSAGAAENAGWAYYSKLNCLPKGAVTPCVVATQK